MLRIIYVVILVILLASCRSGPVLEYEDNSKQTGLAFYYGPDFSMEAVRPSPDELEEIKVDLQSALADGNPGLEDAEREWTKIRNINSNDGFYILFELRPESRLPDSFLQLKFRLNGREPKTVLSYYALDARVSSGTVVTLGYGLGRYPGYGGGFYPMYGGTTGRSVEWNHAYRFLLLFDGELSELEDYTMEVITHNGKSVFLK